MPVAEGLAVRATFAIENARLYSAAQRATRVRDELMGIVAHDLRNPLQSIVLESGFLDRRTEPTSQPTQESVATIRRSARRMDRMIQDLLDIACVETGQLRVARDRVPPGDLLSEALQTQQPMASAKSLELHIEVSEGLPEIWADRDRIVQAFENLIGNALRFTPPGGRITLGAKTGDTDVVFSVADNGAGIAADDLPHVFDRFWRTRKDRLGGAGLGLPIVKGIVEAHGGRIWVQSTPGRGTTFYFTVPMAPYRVADHEHVKT
jgi:signal transduction histidine kinase